MSVIKEKLRLGVKGDATVLVLTLGGDVSSTGFEIEVFAMAIDVRPGGLLIAVPQGSIAESVLEAGQIAADDAVFGPSTFVHVGLVEEADDLSMVQLGVSADVSLVDVSDAILPALREFDPVTDSDANIQSYLVDVPHAFPDVVAILPMMKEWLTARSDERAGFYSAQEDQMKQPAGTAAGRKAAPSKRVTTAVLSDQLAALTAQIQMLAARTEKLEAQPKVSAMPVPGQPGAISGKLPAVSASLPNGGVDFPLKMSMKAGALIGPPPRQQQARSSKEPPDLTMQLQDDPVDPTAALRPIEAEGNIMSAIAQQSTAITALVAHIASQSPDALGDLASLGAASSTTKGVAKRERMQAELANGTSCYYLQMMQQLHRRLYPARPVPTSEDDLSQLSVLTYLERQGGYKGSREMSLVAWVLGHAIDASSAGDLRRTKELMALLLVAVEQSVVDRGDWSLAFLLTLLEEPPVQLYQDRSPNMVLNSRPFGPLVPPQWTAVCLSFLKDMEILASKKTETAKKVLPKQPSKDESADKEGDPSPKRKARFPKKPKAKASPEGA